MEDVKKAFLDAGFKRVAVWSDGARTMVDCFTGDQRRGIEITHTYPASRLGFSIEAMKNCFEREGLTP